MVIIKKSMEIEMAHRLHNHDGDCKHLHGHSYLVEVGIEGIISKESGMILDFKDLKEKMNVAIGVLDHSCILYKDDPLAKYLTYYIDDGSDNLKIVAVNFIPTAENLSKNFYIRLNALLKSYTLSFISVRETKNSVAIYTKEDFENDYK